MGYFSNCGQPLLSLLLFCGIAAGSGAAMNGFYTSMVSLAPPYTGIISSGGRMFSMVAQLITPLIVSMFRNEVCFKKNRFKIVFLGKSQRMEKHFLCHGNYSFC